MIGSGEGRRLAAAALGLVTKRARWSGTPRKAG